jgi:hypothetical protein
VFKVLLPITYWSYLVHEPLGAPLAPVLNTLGYRAEIREDIMTKLEEIKEWLDSSDYNIARAIIYVVWLINRVEELEKNWYASNSAISILEEENTRLVRELKADNADRIELEQRCRNPLSIKKE